MLLSTSDKWLSIGPSVKETQSVYSDYRMFEISGGLPEPGENSDMFVGWVYP